MAMISICMLLKLPGKSSLTLLELIFTSCIEKGKFPSDWKKTNIVSVHKKGEKQVLKYCPIL